jgi:putative phosphonate catabolism associated alcohol dehydrogenase
MTGANKMPLPETCKAAVFEAPGRPLVLRELPLPREPQPGAVLCRIRLSTICGSDLHTTAGRRIEPAPSILGHESVGDVAAAGEGARYANGDPIHIGDRVSWTIMASCGGCFYCARNLPQKCVELIKYGHSPLTLAPGLTGGYAEYIYLFPGTGIFQVPDEIEDAVAAPANCALATVVCAMDLIGGVEEGENVLIAGAGLLGTCLAALVKAGGAGRVVVSDTDAGRAEAVKAFGADQVFISTGDPGKDAAQAREICGGEGVDLAFEVCGDPRAATAALGGLRTGGRLMLAGLVSPESTFALDGNEITRRYLTIKGIHNYRPDHLGRAIDFLAETKEVVPWRDLVSPPYPLEAVNEAFGAARERRFARVALRCDGQG